MADLVSLDLFYLDFRVTLAVTLLTLVLFASLFLEDDDLFAATVAYNRSLDGTVAPDLRVLSGSHHKCLNVDLRAFFTFNTRHPEGLTVFNSELLTASLDNCVTHLYLSNSSKDGISSTRRKAEIIRKTLVRVKPKS